MQLIINHPEISKLARELMAYTGESFNQVLLNALREQLEQIKASQQSKVALKAELLQIGQQCAALPIQDNRLPDEILGYNEIGVPS